MEPHYETTDDGYEQGVLIPPDQIRIELVVWLDGPSNTAQVSPKVQYGSDRELVALELVTGIELRHVEHRAVAILRRAIAASMDCLAPF